MKQKCEELFILLPSLGFQFTSSWTWVSSHNHYLDEWSRPVWQDWEILLLFDNKFGYKSSPNIRWVHSAPHEFSNKICRPQKSSFFQKDDAIIFSNLGILTFQVFDSKMLVNELLTLYWFEKFVRSMQCESYPIERLHFSSKNSEH